MPGSNEARAPQLLSLRSGARKPQLRKPACLEPMLCNKRGHHDERPTRRGEGWPCSPQLEKAFTHQGRPNTVKINKINK